LASELDQFFDTLPRAFYLQVPHEGIFSLVRLSHVGREKTRFVDESRYGRFLFTAPSPGVLATHTIAPDVGFGPGLKTYIKAIVKAEKKRTPYGPLEGLRLLEPDRGATAWSLLSCPTAPYRKILHFYTDSFAIIAAKPTVADWTITHHHQDSRAPKGFATKTYHFFDGGEVGADVTEVEEEEDVLPHEIHPDDVIISDLPANAE